MIFRILVVFLIAFGATAAQAKSPRPAALDEGRVDLPGLRAETDRMRTEAGFAPAATAGPTEAEVGDVDSFGKTKIYLGVVQTKPLFVTSDCTGSDPASEVCVETNPAPAPTVIDEANVGTMVLPGKSSNSILCFTFTQFSTYFWSNSSAGPQTARMEVWPTVQIENSVLDGLVNANGVPFNGALFEEPIPILVNTSQGALSPGESELHRERFTRSCTGGLVNARALRAEGLTDAQIKDFFDEPMNITIGYGGQTAGVDDAIFFHGIRIYGDD